MPRANKRFLSAIIRNTDEHNKAVLRAQAETAQEARARKEEEERRERRERAKEATEAERLRRLMGGSSRRQDDSWDRRDSRRRHSSRERRSDEKNISSDGHRKRRHRSRSNSAPPSESDTVRRNGSRRHRDDDDGHTHLDTHSRSKEPRDRDGRRRSEKGYNVEDSSRKRRKRSNSRSASPSNSRRRRRDVSSVADDDDEQESSRKRLDKGKAVDRSPLGSDSTPLRARTTKDSIPTDVHDADDSLQRNISTKSSRHQTRSLERTNSASSSRLSPHPIDLSSQFKTRNSVQQHPDPPASPTLSEEEDIERFRPRRRHHKVSGHTSRAAEKISSASRPISKSPSPELSSKMDKYFDASYDPRLDTGPLVLPNIPSTGLIDGAEFEGWEAMLDIVRQRREDRAERKRLERLGLLPDDKAKKEKKSLKESGAWTMDAGVSVLDIKYNKRGAVREWDMGK